VFVADISHIARYCDTVDGMRNEFPSASHVQAEPVSFAEHFLISYHDKYPSLFLATGGSGKAFKLR